MSVSEPYPAQLLEAIRNWVNNFESSKRKALAEALKGVLHFVEPEYKTCGVRCYRRIDIPDNPEDNSHGLLTPLLDMCNSGKMWESVSSWTTDLLIAKDHLEGVQSGGICAIFGHTPLPSEVWLNLNNFIKSPRLRPSDIGGNWVQGECEVILNVTNVTADEIISLGGFAGSMDLLRTTASQMGVSDKTPNFESFLKSKAGTERWLSEEGTAAVVQRTFQKIREKHKPL